MAKEGGAVLAEGVAAELAGAELAEAKLHEQGDAASAKLAYLLGLDPESPLVPVDEALAPINVVDAAPPTSALVAQALANGPGVRELQGLLAAIDCGMAELEGPKKFLPTLDLCVGEGAFGAGPDASMTWANRFDLGVEARWNLTELFTAKDEKRLAESKRRQVELTYDDLRGKLTLGVREAREAILTGREQIDRASEQIKRASRELPPERPAAEAERAGGLAGRGGAEPPRPGNSPLQLHHRRQPLQQGPGPPAAAARAGGVQVMVPASGRFTPAARRPPTFPPFFPARPFYLDFPFRASDNTLPGGTDKRLQPLIGPGPPMPADRTRLSGFPARRCRNFGRFPP